MSGAFIIINYTEAANASLTFNTAQVWNQHAILTMCHLPAPTLTIAIPKGLCALKRSTRNMGRLFDERLAIPKGLCALKRSTRNMGRLFDERLERGSVTPKQLQQEAQLMLTTGSTRLAVSRGQQTWYHSTCYIHIVSHCAIVTLSLRRIVFTIFVFKKFHDLEMGVKGH